MIVVIKFYLGQNENYIPGDSFCGCIKTLLSEQIHVRRERSSPSLGLEVVLSTRKVRWGEAIGESDGRAEDDGACGDELPPTPG